MILATEDAEKMPIGEMAKVQVMKIAAKTDFFFRRSSLLAFYSFSAVLPLISVCHTSLGLRGVR